MTSFTKIYEADHQFSDGNIAIANTAINLSKAYLVIDTINIADKLEQPLLIGFLYQIDNDKRSRPYPIVAKK